MFPKDLLIFDSSISHHPCANIHFGNSIPTDINIVARMPCVVNMSFPSNDMA